MKRRLGQLEGSVPETSEAFGCTAKPPPCTRPVRHSSSPQPEEALEHRPNARGQETRSRDRPPTTSGRRQGPASSPDVQIRPPPGYLCSPTEETTTKGRVGKGCEIVNNRNARTSLPCTIHVLKRL